DRTRHRGRVVRVQRRVDDVGRHHGRGRIFTLGGDAEGRELETLQFGEGLVYRRQVAVRVDVGVAVAGEVLDAAGHAFAFAALHPGHGDAGRGVWVGAEGALGDHR